MENRIKKVMSDVFNIDIESIDNDSSPDNIENWDSLKHMNLIVALEEEFDIEFDDNDIENLLNFQLINLTIKEYIDNN
jgi:acyl carrier protein